MEIKNKECLKIFYHLDNPAVYILYQVGKRYFISFVYGGHGGGEKVLEISEIIFAGLNDLSISFDEFIRDHQSASLNKSTLKIYSQYVLEEEPFILYEIDERYFFNLRGERRKGMEIAIEISKDDFDKLFNRKILPSDI